jgi:hypothetical protein
MKSSFEYFLNSKNNHSAELIAKFVDRKMRGEKGLSESDIEILFDKVK